VYLTSLLAAALQGTSQPAEPDGSAAQRQPGDVHEDVTGDEAAPPLRPELQEPAAAELDAAAGAGAPGPESDEAGRTEHTGHVAAGEAQQADAAAPMADEADSMQELLLAPAVGEADMPPERPSDDTLLSDAQPAATESGATGLEMQGDE
jgi:hypothetical protein